MLSVLLKLKISQSGNKDQYNIDLAKDEYIKDKFIHKTNILWITFNYKL
jgi:hypothetical protein